MSKETNIRTKLDKWIQNLVEHTKTDSNTTDFDRNGFLYSQNQAVGATNEK